jgi:hypothetical protein
LKEDRREVNGRKLKEGNGRKEGKKEGSCRMN